jgi:hypothetical protein
MTLKPKLAIEFVFGVYRLQIWARSPDTMIQVPCGCPELTEEHAVTVDTAVPKQVLSTSLSIYCHISGICVTYTTGFGFDD